MKNNIKIDTNLLKSKIDELKKENENMKVLLNNIKNKSKRLHDIWISKTMDTVDSDLYKIYEDFNKVIDKNNQYISYLENVVSSNYIDANYNIYNIIEEKL